MSPVKRQGGAQKHAQVSGNFLPLSQGKTAALARAGAHTLDRARRCRRYRNAVRHERAIGVGEPGHPYNTKYKMVPNSQDIWFAQRDSFGKWGEAMHMEYPLNTYFYNAVYWISPDNNRILIRGAYVDGDYYGNGVSMCNRKKNGNWSKPNMLFINKYDKYDRGRQSGASMAHDGRTLLLYMTPEKGGENNDIFVSFLRSDSIWTEPKSLGKKINGPNTNEMTPYLAADGETLYFSSDRPGETPEIAQSGRLLAKVAVLRCHDHQLFRRRGWHFIVERFVRLIRRTQTNATEKEAIGRSLPDLPCVRPAGRPSFHRAMPIHSPPKPGSDHSLSGRSVRPDRQWGGPSRRRRRHRTIAGTASVSDPRFAVASAR